MQKKVLEIIALIFLVVAVLAPRLPALDAFVTVDEPTWLMRSANFYYALSQREFQNTVYAYHPAVTTMWVGTAGMLWDFPSYRGQGQGYFDKEWQFFDFLSEFGYHPLQLLRTQRLFTVLANAFLLVLLYFLLRRVLGWFPAFSGVLFLSFEPFFLGHTRLLAHEGMLSLLVLVSILAFFNYLYCGRGWGYLLLAGLSASFAALTKSTATLLVPFMGLWCLLDGLLGATLKTPQGSSRLGKIWRQGGRVVGTWTAWFVIFVLGYIAFWPGMWVDPARMLSEVYANAFSYATQGHALDVFEDAGGAVAFGEVSGLWDYARVLLWRTTPATWIGLMLAVVFLLAKRVSLPPLTRKAILILLGLGLAFYLVMALAQGRRSHHYIMLTFACLSTLAGLGIALLLAKVQRWLAGHLAGLVASLLFVLLLSIQVASALGYYPYYYNYSNPIMEGLRPGIQTPVIGFGEGLELAAAYLAENPVAESMTVMSFYGIGPFSFFYPGQTHLIFPDQRWLGSSTERLGDSDYLVLYYYHQLRRDIPAKLLGDIRGVPPEHTLWLNGVEYVRIYRVGDLPLAAFIPDTRDLPDQ